MFDGPFGKALAADIEETLGHVVVLGFPDTILHYAKKSCIAASRGIAAIF